MKLYAIRLLATCMIAGVPRSPAEGIQMVGKADRDRLIAEEQAEDAAADVDNGEDDGLDAKTVPQLRKIAKTEGAAVEGDANKDAVIAAIRAKRSEGSADADDLADMDTEALRETATAEEVEVAEDADDDAIRAAIRDKRSQA